MDGIGFLSGNGGGTDSGDDTSDELPPPLDNMFPLLEGTGKFLARGAFNPPKFKLFGLLLIELFPAELFRFDVWDLCKVVTEAG